MVTLGWDRFFEEQLSDVERASLPVARVVEAHKRYYTIDRGGTGADGPQLAEVAGRFRRSPDANAPVEDYPAVGDWVVFVGRPGGGARIDRVLARRTKLSRKASGEQNEEQVLCANVDVAFIVAALDMELNLRRLERYLLMARSGGVTPVIVLTKVDVVGASETMLADARSVAGDAPVLVVSVRSGTGLDDFTAQLTPGRTAVVLGPSGAGKSSLINHVAGAPVQVVGDVRERDRKGRHTTTARTLVRLPTGALVIDTPGIRELEVWQPDGAPASAETFDEVASVAASCRFRDCTHRVEPGCAVREAVQSGKLEADRVSGYVKLLAEGASQVARVDAHVRAERSRGAKVATRALRARLHEKGHKE